MWRRADVGRKRIICQSGSSFHQSNRTLSMKPESLVHEYWVMAQTNMGSFVGPVITLRDERSWPSTEECGMLRRA